MTRSSTMRGNYRPNSSDSAQISRKRTRLTAYFDLSIVPAPSIKSRGGRNSSVASAFRLPDVAPECVLEGTPMTNSDSQDRMQAAWRYVMNRRRFMGGAAGVGAGLAGFAGGAAAPGFV